MPHQAMREGKENKWDDTHKEPIKKECRKDGEMVRDGEQAQQEGLLEGGGEES